MSDYSRQDILDNVSLEDVEPFEGKLEELPAKVKECEKSIKEDQPSLTKSERIAICRDQLDMADSDCPDGKVLVNGRCVEKESVDAPASVLSSPRFLQGRKLEVGPIERVEENGQVRYNGIKVLTEGIWTDSSSGQPTHYVPENLSLEEENTLNLIHDDDNDVSAIGHVENERHEDGDKYVDFVLHLDNAASEYADENLQKTLETHGAKGFGGPSVEIPPDGLEIEPNGPTGYPQTTDGKIDGVGLVGNQADKNVGFARQTAERAVALSDGQTPLVYTLEDSDMSNSLKAKILSEFTAKELAGPQEVEEEAQSIADELDVPIGDVLEVLDPLFDIDGDDGDDDGNGDDDGMDNADDDDDDDGDDDGDGGDNADDDDGGDDMDMETKVQSLEERLTNLEDMMEQAMAAEDVKEELEEFQQDLADAESVKELEEAKEDLEKRLSDLEDLPKGPRSLSDGEGDDENDIDGEVTFAGSYDTVRGAYSR